MQENSSRKEQRILERIKSLRMKVLEIDHLCSGTVVRSMVRCGKSNCRCANDPDARHGPYYQWNRMKKGKLVHSTITEDQATLLQEAINNYRFVLKLLRSWEEESIKLFGIK
jgi:hypothetical protein